MEDPGLERTRRHKLCWHRCHHHLRRRFMGIYRNVRPEQGGVVQDLLGLPGGIPSHDTPAFAGVASSAKYSPVWTPSNSKAVSWAGLRRCPTGTRRSGGHRRQEGAPFPRPLPDPAGDSPGKRLGFSQHHEVGPGLRLMRQGPWVLPAVWAANFFLTPSLRNSAYRFRPRFHCFQATQRSRRRIHESRSPSTDGVWQ